MNRLKRKKRKKETKILKLKEISQKDQFNSLREKTRDLPQMFSLPSITRKDRKRTRKLKEKLNLIRIKLTSK